MVIEYNVTGHTIKTRQKALAYGLILTGFSLLILTISLYYKAMWYWIPFFMLSVMFLIIGFGLIGVK